MTVEDARKMPLGAYMVFWNSGGHSTALISQTYNGTRIINCANWTANNKMSRLEDQIMHITKMVFLFY